MLAALGFALTMSTPSINAKELGRWGEETLQRIQRGFSIPGSPLYAEAIVSGDPRKEIAFNWSAGVLLSALNAASRWDPKWKSVLRSFAEAVHSYWNQTPPVPGFDVLPHATSVDRFYDDNAWMVMAYAETYELLEDRKYLTWAQDALRFCLSGRDDRLGGGIYWRENEKTSKNTCSNAPVAAACLAIYKLDPDPAWLQTAQDLYAWTKENLQDPADGLYWDSIRVSDGHIEKTKWTYNTALMIRTATELYRLTHDRAYLNDERAMHRASRERWLSADGALADDGPFAHLLLEAWIRSDKEDPGSDEAKADTRARALLRPLAFLHGNCERDGLYGKRWERGPAEDQKRFRLIDQASAARGYFEAALAMRK